MKVTFSLRKDKVNKDGLMPVRMTIAINGERIRRNVPPVKCTLKDWDGERIRKNKRTEKDNHYIRYNKILDELEAKVKQTYSFMLLNEIPLTAEHLIEKLDSNDLHTKNQTYKFYPSFQEFIETSKNTKALGTIKKYKTVLKFIQDFEAFTKYTIRFDTINQRFYDLFQEYSFEERNTLNNYFGKLIAIIKTFMRWSLEKGYHQNTDFEKFKKLQDEIEVIYLKKDELFKLYEYDFKSDRLNHVRDFFCLGCFTGLRVSDLLNLKESNIYEDYIKIAIQKTKTIDQIIPLNDYAKAILKKYEDTLYYPIPQISTQKLNQYIKECCLIIGLTENETLTRYIGQKRIQKTVPKYTLITSHIMRKTFVTNSLQLGMSEIVVRNITGHKDHSSFKRYVKIAEDHKMDEMKNAWNK